MYRPIITQKVLIEEIATFLSENPELELENFIE